ncbi:RISC-loading complex subunit tarbp2 [Halocaridina rubra]|uniref:RISC-loading complex subunit tarbp2 n=1 Tax=Halocaridina rubra TaxID=373956 RepID=A0AAN8WRG3_HALRR
MSGALPSKTPVSLLQELCMRRGISPKYDLLQIEGAVHEPTFVYRVTVDEFAANGSGHSKKKAKHSAAKAMLDIIIQGGAAGTGDQASGGPDDAPPELSTQIVPPHDDGIPGNPVGALQELCMVRSWPSPTYELTLEEGVPHERTFSVSCTIGTTKEVGTGKKKKLAKRQAAYKMTQRMKDQPVEQPQLNTLTDDDNEVNVCGGMRHGSLGVHDAFHNWKRVVNSKRNRTGELTLNIVLEKRKNENAVFNLHGLKNGNFIMR